jgi:hypothetical protein
MTILNPPKNTGIRACFQAHFVTNCITHNKPRLSVTDLHIVAVMATILSVSMVKKSERFDNLQSKRPIEQCKLHPPHYVMSNKLLVNC